jgi:hypothetical protein
LLICRSRIATVVVGFSLLADDLLTVQDKFCEGIMNLCKRLLLHHRLLYGFRAVIATSVVLALVACSPLEVVIDTGATQVPDIHSPLLHPNAKELHVLSSADNWERLTYEVDASADKVLEFYRTTLPQQGWIDVPLNEPNKLRMGWTGSGKGPFLTFIVIAEPSTDGITTVTVKTYKAVLR